MLFLFRKVGQFRVVNLRNETGSMDQLNHFGMNTKTVQALISTCKFQFSSGDVEFDIAINGELLEDCFEGEKAKYV